MCHLISLVNDNHVANNLKEILVCVYFGSIANNQPKKQYIVTISIANNQPKKQYIVTICQQNNSVLTLVLLNPDIPCLCK